MRKVNQSRGKHGGRIVTSLEKTSKRKCAVTPGTICRTNEIHQGAEINKKNISQTMQLKREASTSSFAVRPSLDHDR